MSFNIFNRYNLLENQGLKFDDSTCDQIVGNKTEERENLGFLYSAQSKEQNQTADKRNLSNKVESTMIDNTKVC